MVRRRVATAFVARGGRVLLLRRSARVSTFAGRWAGVSGAVEAGEDPETAARRELEEELGLGKRDVALVRAGLAVDVEAEERRRLLRFRVHPFLFELSRDRELRLDWEHDAALWVSPDEVIALAATQETVPELDEALARVWDPPAALPPPFREEARAIFEDRRSGAAELARRAAALVAQGAPAERVAALRPTMAPVVNAARAAGRRGLAVVDEIARAQAAVAAAARRRLTAGTRVATFSRSSTVVAALDGAPPLRLLVGHSLPGGEGEATYAAARAAGHEATLLPDDELRRRVGEGAVELVLVGADAILPSGDVVNKIGTRALATAARATGTPVVVVADRWKRWDDEVPPPLEPVLEVVPAALISAVVTDESGRQ